MISRIGCKAGGGEGSQHLYLGELSQGQVWTFFEVEALSN